MSTDLSAYSVVYTSSTGSGSITRTFAQLNIKSARIVSGGLAGEYADLVIDVSVNDPGMPFVPLQRHAIYDPSGTLRFVGWLMQPGRDADPVEQTQTFRLDGPNSRLQQRNFQQPWNYPVDPTSYTSDLAPKVIPRLLLNREDYTTGTRLDVKGQIKEVLDYYVGKYGDLAPVVYDGDSLEAIPLVQPPEDEQTDMDCLTVILRELKYAPKVTGYWRYPASVPVPQLVFVANDAVPASAIAPAPPTTGGVVALSDGTGIVIDLNSGVINKFSSRPRYDLLVREFTVFLQTEKDVTDDGSPTGKRKLWATLAEPDVSTADNPSDKEVTYCYDLRGAADLRDPVTGLPIIPQEGTPTGLASAFHDPFKVLTHSLSWSITAQDVEWTTHPGMAVGVRNGGDDELLGSRSIIQQVTRDIGTGTTSYTAGPPAKLGINDIIALTRMNRTRNAAGHGGGNGGNGSSNSGGKKQQQTGQKTPQNGGGGSGGGLGPNYYTGAANGLPCYFLINGSAPLSSLPDGTTVVNPA